MFSNYITTTILCLGFKTNDSTSHFIKHAYSFEVETKGMHKDIYLTIKVTYHSEDEVQMLAICPLALLA
jgi:hypothetical protein